MQAKPRKARFIGRIKGRTRKKLTQVFAQFRWIGGHRPPSYFGLLYARYHGIGVFMHFNADIYRLASIGW